MYEIGLFVREETCFTKAKEIIQCEQLLGRIWKEDRRSIHLCSIGLLYPSYSEYLAPAAALLHVVLVYRPLSKNVTYPA